jgi:Omp85 superfamily domain
MVGKSILRVLAITAAALICVAARATDEPCFAQTPAGAQSANDGLEPVKADALAATYWRQLAGSLWNVTGAKSADTTSPTPQPQSTGGSGRFQDRDRNFPQRESRTAIRLVKHVNGIFGGLESGSGLGLGLELTTADSIPGVEFRLTAITSTKLYRRFEGEAYFPKIGDEKTHASLWYGYTRRTKDNFFGIGPRTTRADETNYDLERRSVNAGLFRDFSEELQAGVYVSYVNSDAYRGQDDADPPIDLLFSNSPFTVPITRFIPGLHSGSKTISYGAFVEADARNNDSGLTKGFFFYGRLYSTDGLDKGNLASSDYGWIGAELDARGYIPVFSDKTSLVLRVAADLKDPKGGSLIPFYDLSSIGGFSRVRGFNTFRYRGNNSFVANVEVRQTVYAPSETRGVDVIVFGDAGQVWGDNRSKTDPAILLNDDFDSSNWRASFGGGLQYRHTKSLVVRVDVARTFERNHAYITLSRGF